MGTVWLMSWIIAPPAQVDLAILGHPHRFPVRRVFCVGQNYAEHAKEMGSDGRQPPFFFCKASQAVTQGERFVYPRHSAEVHHEIELVVALKAGGREISSEHALELVWGYGVGLDMTCRDLQAAAKKAGRPWEASKAFDGSAPCSALVSKEQIGHPNKGAVWLEVNGASRQRGDLAQMIWKVPEILVELSRFFQLAAGDLVFTGTPSGVGPVQLGDRLRGGVDGVGELTLEVVAESDCRRPDDSQL